MACSERVVGKNLSGYYHRSGEMPSGGISLPVEKHRMGYATPYEVVAATDYARGGAEEKCG